MKPKKLSLGNIWKMYLLLKPVLDDREIENVLLDEIIILWDELSPNSLLEVLQLLNDNISIENTATELKKLFVDGILSNNLFSFVVFIREVLK